MLGLTSVIHSKVGQLMDNGNKFEKLNLFGPAGISNYVTDIFSMTSKIKLKNYLNIIEIPDIPRNEDNSRTL